MSWEWPTVAGDTTSTASMGQLPGQGLTRENDSKRFSKMPGGLRQPGLTPKPWPKGQMLEHP
jgi:hypothetical protein